MQPRFEMRAGRRPFHLLTHPRFRAAYDFMLLRCESGELDPELGEWWKKFSVVDNTEREKMLLKQTAPKRKRRRSRKKEVTDTMSPVTSDLSDAD